MKTQFYQYYDDKTRITYIYSNMNIHKQQPNNTLEKDDNLIQNHLYERINHLVEQQDYSFISLVHWAQSKQYFHSDCYELWFLEALNMSVKFTNSSVPSLAHKTFGIKVERATEIILFFIELNAPIWLSKDNVHVLNNTIENALQAGYYFPSSLFDLETVCYFIEPQQLQEFRSRNILAYKNALAKELPHSNTNKHQTKV